MDTIQRNVLSTNRCVRNDLVGHSHSNQYARGSKAPFPSFTIALVPPNSSHTVLRQDRHGTIDRPGTFFRKSSEGPPAHFASNRKRPWRTLLRSCLICTAPRARWLPVLGRQRKSRIQSSEELGRHQWCRIISELPSVPAQRAPTSSLEP